MLFRSLATLPDTEKNSEENIYIKEQILGQYAVLEEQAKDIPKALQLLEQLKPIAPNPQEVQKRIDELKAGIPAHQP